MSARLGRWLACLGVIAAVVGTPSDSAVAVSAVSPPNEIAYARTDSTGTHIVSRIFLTSDVPTPTQLTFGPASDSQPAWSPDATQIAFTRTTSTGSSLWVMNADGSSQRELLPNASQPDWRWDGQAIAFTRTTRGNTDVWSVSPDGGAPIRLTNDPAVDRGPAWFAPDVLAFVSTRTGRAQLFEMAADGSGQRRLLRDPASDRGPTLLEDTVYFSRAHRGQVDIWTASLSGGDLHRVTDTPAPDRGPAAVVAGYVAWSVVNRSGIEHLWFLCPYCGDPGPYRFGFGSDATVSDADPAFVAPPEWIARWDQHARENLAEAGGVAQQIYDTDGTFGGVTPIRMTSLDPSLTYFRESSESVGGDTVSMAARDTVWAAASLSATGTCFGIRLDATAATTYGSWTVGSCTGAEALAAAADPSW